MSLVPQGSVPADIGTDHGFLPIELVRRGIVEKAYALDVRKGPLSRAEEHISQAALSGRITTRLSDGFAALKPGEADTAVIAGMGGGLMVRLLTEGEAVVNTMKALVLSPHSEAFLVRRYLRQHGWEIEEEKLCREEDKFYPAFRAVRGKSVTEEALDQPGKSTTEEASRQSGKNVAEEAPRQPEKSATEAPPAPPEHNRQQAEEDEFGPLLLKRKDPVLKEYLQKRLRQNEKIREQLGEESSRAKDRRKELEEEEIILREALKRVTEENTEKNESPKPAQ